MKRHVKKSLAGLVAAGMFAVSPAQYLAAAESSWYPLVVKAQKTASVDTELVDYLPLSASGTASEDWSICVSYPHLKDPFFVATNFGMVEEAKLLGVSMQSFDAGGYTALSTQVNQIENCVAGGADAVVMVAIAAEGMGNLLDQLKEKGIPVIDAVNGVTSPDTAARVLTSPYDEGLRAGEFLAEKHPAGTEQVNVAWLPGPAGAGFVTAFSSGFDAGIKDSAVRVVETKHGDVGKEVQSRLVEDLLQTHDDLDYLVGTAVMAEAAVPILKARGVADEIKLVSVYMTRGVYNYLQRGDIYAAGAAPISLTGRIMLDQAVRVLEGKLDYSDVGTLGKVYTKESAGEMKITDVMAPLKYRPIFNLSN